MRQCRKAIYIDSTCATVKPMKSNNSIRLSSKRVVWPSFPKAKKENTQYRKKSSQVPWYLYSNTTLCDIDRLSLMYLSEWQWICENGVPIRLWAWNQNSISHLLQDFFTSALWAVICFKSESSVGFKPGDHGINYVYHVLSLPKQGVTPAALNSPLTRLSCSENVRKEMNWVDCLTQSQKKHVQHETLNHFHIYCY